MQSSAMQPVQTTIGAPAVAQEETDARPTEIRYGYCPFGDINLVNGDGTMSLYVQPHLLDTPYGMIENPHHRVLPQGQLIPFQTFEVLRQMPSPTERAPNGRAALVTEATVQTALEAIVSTLRVYSRWGFVICASLQGVDQTKAMRIFQVVQPLRFPLGQLERELEFGAEDRIRSEEPISFESIVPGYIVQPLRDDGERAIARALAAELLGGVGTAIGLATEILDETESSMTSAHAGGLGKRGPDPLDRRLCDELGRKLPQFIGQAAQQAPVQQQATIPAELTEAINLLAKRAYNEDQAAIIAGLQAKLATFESGETKTVEQVTPPVTSTVPVITCGYPTSGGAPCKTQVRADGDRCFVHKDK